MLMVFGLLQVVKFQLFVLLVLSDTFVQVELKLHVELASGVLLVQLLLELVQQDPTVQMLQLQFKKYAQLEPTLQLIHLLVLQHQEDTILSKELQTLLPLQLNVIEGSSVQQELMDQLMKPVRPITTLLLLL